MHVPSWFGSTFQPLGALGSAGFPVPEGVALPVPEGGVANPSSPASGHGTGLSYGGLPSKVCAHVPSGCLWMIGGPGGFGCFGGCGGDSAHPAAIVTTKAAASRGTFLRFIRR